VGVLLRHSTDTLVAILGILKSGAAYVPLDPEHPIKRVRQLLADSNTPVVVTTADLAGILGDDQVRVCLDGDTPALDRQPTASPGVPVSAEAAAYVIYTSGSTGRPKGIVISHRALVNYIVWANATYLNGEPLRFALHSSLSFDLTVTSIFCPITTGGTVVAYSGVSAEPAIFSALREDRVEVIKLTPSHLSLIAEKRDTPSRLRTLIVGGESLDTGLARRIHTKFDGRVAVFNEYGPTEATVGCMVHRYDPTQDVGESVPIGRAGANAEILILDDNRRPVGPDIVGEIYIGGPGLATEYLDEPGLTAERFVAHPFKAGERLYRTGDLARLLPSGLIEYLGRNDDEVKIRGHRIHLTNVQHVLAQYPTVHDCSVRYAQDVGGRRSLVAYYVADAPVPEHDLRKFLRQRLVQAAVPSAFAWLQQLPLTTNGKIDFAALPSLEDLRQRSAPAAVQPASGPTERRLVAIWSRLLQLKHVGTTGGFFELGGDSLLAMQLTLEIEEEFGVQLPASILFEHDTIERLASAIDAQRSGAPTHLVQIHPGGSRPPLFLFHGIAGETLGFKPLVDNLSPEQPVFGLQGEGAAFASGGSLRIEAMAAKYLTAIRTVQPTGPYQLAGYSAGGITAFEAARQIVAEGERVDLLAIIDGDAPPAVTDPLRPSVGTAARTIANLWWWVPDDLLQSDMSDVWSRIRSTLRVFRRARRGTRRSDGLTTAPDAGRDRQPDIRDAAGVPGLPERFIPWLEAYVDAMRRYEPKPYTGEIVVIRARTFGLGRPVRHDRGWGGLGKRVTVRVVRGNHSSIMQEPAVRLLAAEFEQLLATRHTDA
jgi:amino acid adenylation domain-containing protein